MGTIDDAALKWALIHADRALTLEEGAEFDAWYAQDVRHKGAYLRAQGIHNALSRATVQENLRPRGAALARQPVAASLTLVAGNPRPPRRRALLALGALAAGLGLVALRLPLPWQAHDPILETAKGEFRKVPLADHSVASINSGSRLALRYTDQTRGIELQRGEAWFEVAKDKTKPFVVESGAVRVRAVGTAFGVRREAGGTEILVTEGVVAVSTGAADGAPVHLKAGERSFVADGAAGVEVQHNPDEVARRLAWREGKIIFMNHTLRDAVADFNRYSSRPIVIADRAIEERTLVGQYQIDAPERFARDIAAFLHVPVAVTAREIRIGRSI